MPGRRPYPISVIEATNDRRHMTKAEMAERRKKEPKPNSTTLRCPGHLGVAERKEWRRLVRLYKELDAKLLCDLDSNMLEQYVVEWVRWRKAQEEIRKTSEVVRDSTNPRKTMPNPWLEVERAASTVCLRISSLLLLNVVSRTKIGSKKDDEDESDPMAVFLRNHRPDIYK